MLRVCIEEVLSRLLFYDQRIAYSLELPTALNAKVRVGGSHLVRNHDNFDAVDWHSLNCSPWDATAQRGETTAPHQ